MGDVLEIKPYDEVECVVCKHVVRFYEDEYKKPCNYCGTWIFGKVRYRQNSKNNAKRQEEEEKCKCWVCLDKGIVEYPVQQGMGVYTYVARCFCPKGINWPSTIPLLDQCEHAPRPEFIELRNRDLMGRVWKDR